MRKIPLNTSRKRVALVLFMQGRGEMIEKIPQNISRIEETSSRYFEERGNFSTLDWRKRWQDWGNSLKYFKEKTALVLWILERADSIKEKSSKCFEEKMGALELLIWEKGDGIEEIPWNISNKEIALVFWI